MKYTIEAEDVRQSNFDPFADTIGGPLETRSVFGETEPAGVESESSALDKFLSAVKWVFLYLPGTAVIHLIMMGMSLLVFYQAISLEMAVGTAGSGIFAVFMIMLGIGKLGDLRYLRVVGGIGAISAIASIVYSILISFIPGDFFGTYFQLTLPLAVLAGYMVKKDTDRKTES